MSYILCPSSDTGVRFRELSQCIIVIDHITRDTLPMGIGFLVMQLLGAMV